MTIEEKNGEKVISTSDFEKAYQKIAEVIDKAIKESVLLTNENYEILVNHQYLGIQFRSFFEQFFAKDGRGYPTRLNASMICDYITVHYPFIKYGGIFYIYRNGVYVADTDQTMISCIINNLIIPEKRSRHNIQEVITQLNTQVAFKKEWYQINDYPKHFINFKNGMYDLIQKRMIPHDPKYFSINQIPHEYNRERKYKSVYVDKFLEETFPDKNDRKMVLTMFGLCMTRDNDMQRFLVILGKPRSGKSTVLKLLERVLGNENITSKELIEITDKFGAVGMVGKLANIGNDISPSAITDPTIMKKITGTDSLSVQRKGKDAFDTKIYARLIFSANEIPPVRTKDDAFFRRPMIAYVDNVPKKVDTNLFYNLESEIDYFIDLCVKAAEEYYQTEDTLSIESENSKQWVKYWQRKGDTVSAFLFEKKPLEHVKYIKPMELYEQYKKYCQDEERTPLTRNNFYDSMKTKGFITHTIHGIEHFKGENKPIEFKEIDIENTPFD